MGTKSSTLVISHPVKFFRPLGMENLSSLDVSPRVRLAPLTPYQNQLNLIKTQLSLSQMLETLMSSYALPFALIWAAFQFPTWEHTRDGCAFATVPFTTSSDVCVRDQRLVTFHPLTIRCTEKRCVLKR